MRKRLKRRQARHQLDGLPDLLSRLYVGRGVTHVEEVNHRLANLHRPDQLKGIRQAAELLADAIATNESILVVGDFDADGATSCVLLVHGLRAMGAKQVDYLVPNRFDFGYGLTPEIVEVAARQMPSLIVTVDNGISSHEGVAHATSLGIKTIVTDHHLPADSLPLADAIVNPNQPGCEFPSKHLAGVGVAFYLLSMVRQVLKERNWFGERPLPNLADYLDLVALGTIADVVPLDGNNRILVNEGLKRIRAGKVRVGLRAMLAMSGSRIETLTSQGLAFGVAPRLNAAGRLEDISLGIECLLTDDEARAGELAAKLDQLNLERREIEQEMKAQAISTMKDLAVENKQQQVGICLFDKSWHQGVVGIVAARIKDRLHRPVVAFARVSENELKGSARSIPGLHIRDAFDSIATRNPGLLSKFGGHAMAAGLTLHPDNLKQFSEQFDLEARRWLTDEDLEAVIVTDGQLPAPASVALAREISLACPWGQGFPEPIFDGEFEIISQRIVGGRHLKLQVRPIEGSAPIDAIAFGVDRLVEGRNRHIAYRLDVNEYRGMETVQLVVESLDLEVSRVKS